MGASRHRVVWHFRTYLPGKHVGTAGSAQTSRWTEAAVLWATCKKVMTPFITGWVPVAVWTVISTHGHTDSPSSCFQIPQNMSRSFSEMIGADSRKIQEPVRSA